MLQNTKMQKLCRDMNQWFVAVEFAWQSFLHAPHNIERTVTGDGKCEFAKFAHFGVDFTKPKDTEML